MSLLHFYRKPVLLPEKKDNLVSLVRQKISPEIYDIQTEYCFNIEAIEPLTKEELETLRWLLSETFEPEYAAGTGIGGVFLSGYVLIERMPISDIFRAVGLATMVGALGVAWLRAPMSARPGAGCAATQP